MNTDFPNTVIVNGETIDFLYIDGVITTLIENVTISPKAIASFEIICHECKKPQQRKVLTLKLMTLIYNCQSCNKKGDRNPFFGQAHSEGLKGRLSAERKGTWGVGESNAMFGKSVKEFVTAEKFEEMREKNRIDSKNRINNPFRNIKDYIGPERWQASIEKKSATIRNRTPEEKLAYSKLMSKVAKETQAKDPEQYRLMKQKAARIAAQRKPYIKNRLEEKVENWLQKKD